VRMTLSVKVNYHSDLIGTQARDEIKVLRTIKCISIADVTV
jgi:hypothetical protein